MTDPVFDCYSIAAGLEADPERIAMLISAAVADAVYWVIARLSGAKQTTRPRGGGKGVQ